MPRIKEDVENTIEIKKSKFICYLHRTNDEQEAKDFLKSIKKTHSSATHHCSAMIIGDIVRSNDDGEPSQTAGQPMLMALQGHELQDIIAVVVRYFGGIKLGTGGLVRAYGSSVSKAIEQATLVHVVDMNEYAITFAYDYIGKVESFFRQNDIEIAATSYDANVTIHYLCQHDIQDELIELTNGTATINYIQTLQHEKAI